MLSVSPAYNAAINNINGRYITAKVNIYFDGPENAPVVLRSNDYIIQASLLEEARAETESPLGSISSNELTLHLLNTNDRFNPYNGTGPYYGKLKPGVKVELFFLLETSDDVFEEVPMGIFKTSNWTAPSDGMTATVICYDKLYELCQLPAPRLPVIRNTTLKSFCELLFATLGLAPTEYAVDSTLAIPLSYAWYKNTTVREALQDLAVAGCANINVDRSGVIRVASILRTSELAATLKDIEQVIATDVPQSYYSTYQKIKVKHITPRLSEVKLLSSVKNVKIPVEGLTLTDLAISEGPVASVDKIVLVGAVNTRILTFGFSAYGLDILINNTGAEETVTLEVYGRVVSIIENSYMLSDDNPVIAEDKTLVVSSQFLQSSNVAKEMANTLLRLARDPSAYVTVECRGNPALEVFDLVGVDSPSTNMALNIVPIRYTYTYDGGLYCTISGIKQTILHLDEWVYISPGLYIQASRYLFKEE